MLVQELEKFGVEKKYVERLEKEGIKKFYPPQEKALKKGLLEGKNLVLAVPTAAGKTLVATLAMIKSLEKGKKAIYVVPLISLANEKYEYYTKFFKERKVAISVGDFDSADPWLERYDVIVVTVEKLDSLIRHGAPWLCQTGLVVFDEVHLLNDPSRGPTLEILITKMRTMLKRAQFLFLSATIKNAEELAEWLDAILIKSDFRPTKLYEGIAYDSKIWLPEMGEIKLREDLSLEEAIAFEILKRRKQAIFFVATRRNAESLALKLASLTRKHLGRNERELLKKLGDEIENVLEIPTSQCKKEGRCVRGGVAFHHAGLLGAQKRMIEKAFKRGWLKFIVATPTLAYGVNLPAFAVIIRDARRYYPGIGSKYIPVLEYMQMVGRAGRPAYDEYGISMLTAKTEDEARVLFDRFIMGEMEEISSKLAIEPVLRMHVLALIATNFCNSERSIFSFFSKTFFAHQWGDISMIEEKVLEVIDLLREWGFLEKKRLVATDLGKRVCQLYLDPLSAHIFIEALRTSKKINDFGILHLISSVNEMKPLPSVRLGELGRIEEEIAKREEDFLIEIPEEWDLEFEDFLKSVKMAGVFEDWINEASEERILESYNITPGELRGRIEIADWLLYSLHEIALLLGMKNFLKDVRKLRVRVQKGVKEELLPLVRLRGVGRVRARKLFEAGIRRVSDLKKVPVETLAKIIGPKTAENLKEQVERKKKKDVQKTLWSGAAGI